VTRPIDDLIDRWRPPVSWPSRRATTSEVLQGYEDDHASRAMSSGRSGCEMGEGWARPTQG
jgi:hypothetical protein